MSLFEFNSEEKFEASSRELLDGLGIELTVGYDFDEFKRISAEARPDHAVADPFQIKSKMHDRKDAMWIVGRDAAGKVMHTHAMRVLPMEGMTVAEYFRRNYRSFLPERHTIDMKRSTYRPGPSAKRMAGRVIYAGEFWIGGSAGQFRGTGLSNLLGRYSFLLAIREMSPDYIMGFMTRPVAYKGFVLRLGYLHAEPYAISWYQKGSYDMNEGVMTFMSHDDMRFSLDLPLERPTEEMTTAIAA